jgi:hypothetical protein
VPVEVHLITCHKGTDGGGGGVEVKLYTFFNHCTILEWVVDATPQLFYPLCRKLGGPQGWSGWVWKISLDQDSIPRLSSP